jgi:hypothetical protein
VHIGISPAAQYPAGAGVIQPTAVPGIGKAAAVFSRDWKKAARRVPRLGKKLAEISKPWKRGGVLI